MPLYPASVTTSRRKITPSLTCLNSYLVYSQDQLCEMENLRLESQQLREKNWLLQSQLDDVKRQKESGWVRRRSPPPRLVCLCGLEWVRLKWTLPDTGHPHDPGSAWLLLNWVSWRYELFLALQDKIFTTYQFSELSIWNIFRCEIFKPSYLHFKVFCFVRSFICLFVFETVPHYVLELTL